MAGGNSCSKTKCYWTEVWENFTIKMAKHWNRLPREDSLYLEVLTFHVSTLSYLPAKLALLCIGSWVKQTPEVPSDLCPSMVLSSAGILQGLRSLTDPRSDLALVLGTQGHL